MHTAVTSIRILSIPNINILTHDRKTQAVANLESNV